MTIICAFLIYLVLLILTVKLILWIYTGVHFDFGAALIRALISYLLVVIFDRLRAADR